MFHLFLASLADTDSIDSDLAPPRHHQISGMVSDAKHVAITMLYSMKLFDLPYLSNLGYAPDAQAGNKQAGPAGQIRPPTI